jgi:hypothetical protein
MGLGASIIVKSNVNSDLILTQRLKLFNNQLDFELDQLFKRIRVQLFQHR